MAKKLINILDEYGLRKMMMTCMKNKRSNLNVMIITLKYFGSYDVLQLEESFQETCFCHVFSKACQYATRDEKVYKWFKYVFIKFALSRFAKMHHLTQKNITKVNMSGINLS
jgi:hypothetical protein